MFWYVHFEKYLFFASFMADEITLFLEFNSPSFLHKKRVFLFEFRHLIFFRWLVLLHFIENNMTLKMNNKNRSHFDTSNWSLQSCIRIIIYENVFVQNRNDILIIMLLSIYYLLLSSGNINHFLIRESILIVNRFWISNKNLFHFQSIHCSNEYNAN